MTFHDLAPEDEDVIVMFHPLGVCWDIFDLVTPILTKKYRVVIPAIPGMDPDRPDATFTSVEQIAAETAAEADYLADRAARLCDDLGRKARRNEGAAQSVRS